MKPKLIDLILILIADSHSVDYPINANYETIQLQWQLSIERYTLHNTKNVISIAIGNNRFVNVCALLNWSMFLFVRNALLFHHWSIWIGKISSEDGFYKVIQITYSPTSSLSFDCLTGQRLIYNAIWAVVYWIVQTLIYNKRPCQGINW